MEIKDFFEEGTVLLEKDGFWSREIAPDPDFEAAYLAVREKENRLQSDEMVRQLPLVSESHVHASEWRMRAASTERVLSTLHPNTDAVILDIGCGNGWFTHHLFQKTGARVIGLDVNGMELAQAARVFQGEQLTFLMADLFDEKWRSGRFDFLNSSVQYFPDFAQLLERLNFLLKEGGEIHILDSPLYKGQEIAAAKKRTEKYYGDLGFPEMAKYYYHHARTEVDFYYPEWKYWPKPKRWWSRGPEQNPFPWAVLR